MMGKEVFIQTKGWEIGRFEMKKRWKCDTTGTIITTSKCEFESLTKDL